MNTVTIGKRQNKPLAAFLVLWLSGAFFLLLCTGSASAGPSSCPLAAMSSHCPHGKRSSGPAIADAGRNSVDCCAFIPALFDKVRTADSPVRVAIAAKIPTSPKRLNISAASTPRPAVEYSPPKRSVRRSFVKNCVFRI